MADQRRQVYPRIPPKNWWDLRRQFKRSLPAQVTAGYLAPTLQIGEKSAVNLIGPLKLMGLIDDQGRPTDRANDWRSDDHYADVCHQIRSECYPSELTDSFPGPDIDRSAAERWFSRIGKMGDASAKNVSAIFEVLTRADVSGQDGSSAVAGGGTRSISAASPAGTRRRTPRSPRLNPVVDNPGDGEHGTAPRREAVPSPSFHINVQIHISAEATADQIDQIFSSMARHLGMGSG